MAFPCVIRDDRKDSDPLSIFRLAIIILRSMFQTILFFFFFVFFFFFFFFFFWGGGGGGGGERWCFKALGFDQKLPLLFTEQAEERGGGEWFDFDGESSSGRKDPTSSTVCDTSLNPTKYWTSPSEDM